MAKKRKQRSKRSMGALPKGLPHRPTTMKQQTNTMLNPFEYHSAGHKRPKHLVHNRTIGTQVQKARNMKAAAAGATAGAGRSQPPLKRRSQHLLQESLQQAKKANVFVDHRIGEYNRHMTVEEQNLARLVKERSIRSRKRTKYSLQDDDDDNDKGGAAVLTHRGAVIDDKVALQSVLLSDDEDDDGNLDALDTALHFGGSATGGGGGAYGPGGEAPSMAQAYSQRKTELDDLIIRRKTLKLERMKAREQQEDVVATLDDSFKELTSMLQFRDKEKEIKTHIKEKRAGTLPADAQEMEDWEKEIREYSAMGRRAKATDRTKTPEEIAKEEAERLHRLETRRLARMNGDFSDDGFSDVSDDDDDKRSKKRLKKNNKQNKNASSASGNPDELESSDDEDADEADESKLTAKFTGEGLVYINKKGEVVKRVGEDESEDGGKEEENADEDSSDGENEEAKSSNVILKIGARVQGNYRAHEQFEDKEHWYDGVISKVNEEISHGNVTYNVDYDDGDFEEDMEPENIRPVAKTEEEQEKDEEKKDDELALKRKRQKARDKARSEIPFVFEIPTTLDALHTMIATYASTGEDASLIIQRIHAANSVKLDRRNTEKMQNFYDVLLRRFMAVGDALYNSGDGGPTLGRYEQLNSLTKTLFQMTQDSPAIAGAVWNRRIGFLQNAHAKRLRDAEFERPDVTDHEEVDEHELSAWPTVGTLLLLRVVGHLFPVTDRRHHIITPVLLLLGQMISQTPIMSMYDLVMGTMCAGLMLEYTREAKRNAPEALGFLAGVIRLYSSDPKERLKSKYPVPTLEAAATHPILSALRKNSSKSTASLPSLCLEKSAIMNTKDAAASVLVSVLHFVESTATNLSGAMGQAEREVFSALTETLLCLHPNSKSSSLSEPIRKKVAATAAAVANACKLDEKRAPLMRRQGPTVRETALKSLAPRLEDPERYSKSKDKGKNPEQVAIDRTKREYKREHKAVARELRLDAAFIENQRREEEERKTSRARAERQKNFAWLEGEQAAMNHQVRQGGGLLKGGGVGAAKSKAASAKLGMKKGGKF